MEIHFSLLSDSLTDNRILDIIPDIILDITHFRYYTSVMIRVSGGHISGVAMFSRDMFVYGICDIFY